MDASIMQITAIIIQIIEVNQLKQSVIYLAICRHCEYTMISFEFQISRSVKQ